MIKTKIIENMLSYYYKDISNKLNILVGGVKKLVPSLGNKYILYI